MRYPHLIITGEAGHGKDTVADHLVEKLGYCTIAFADLQKKEVISAYSNSPEVVDIDFLLIRETKKTPSDRLSLVHCNDADFVKVALATFKQEDMDLFKLRKKGILDNPRHNEYTEKERLTLPRSPRRITQTWGTEFRRQSEFGHELYWIDPVTEFIKKSTKPVIVKDGRTPQELEWAKLNQIERIHVVRPGYGETIVKHVTEIIPDTDQNTLTLLNDKSLLDLISKVNLDVIPSLQDKSPRTKVRYTL
jgi:hypothetical protein